MDVDGLPEIIEEVADEFSEIFLLEARGTRSNDPTLQYLIQVCKDKVVEWERQE